MPTSLEELSKAEALNFAESSSYRNLPVLSAGSNSL